MRAPNLGEAPASFVLGLIRRVCCVRATNSGRSKEILLSRLLHFRRFAKPRNFISREASPVQGQHERPRLNHRGEIRCKETDRFGCRRPGFDRCFRSKPTSPSTVLLTSAMSPARATAMVRPPGNANYNGIDSAFGWLAYRLQWVKRFGQRPEDYLHARILHCSGREHRRWR